MMIEFLESVGNCLMSIARHDDYFNMYFYISQADVAKVGKKYQICIAKAPVFYVCCKKICVFC